MDRDSNLMLMAATIKALLIWGRRKAEASIDLQIQSIMKGSSNKTSCGGVGCTDSPMEMCMRGISSLISVMERAITYLVMAQRA